MGVLTEIWEKLPEDDKQRMLSYTDPFLQQTLEQWDAEVTARIDTLQQNLLTMNDALIKTMSDMIALRKFVVASRKNKN